MTFPAKVLLVLLIASIAANAFLYERLGINEALKVSSLSKGEFRVQYAEDGGEILRLLDKDQNGTIDMMYQRIKEESGGDIRDVLDYDLDGQDDLKVEFDDGIGYVWFDGRWEKFTFEAGRWYVNVGGTQVELTENNSLMVKWHKHVYGE